MAKRNAHGSGSIRKRTDGLWEARYTAGRDPGTGKQVQRSIYGKTQKEVRQKLAQVVTELDNGTYIAPQRMTVGEWLDIWLEEYTGNIKPTTRRSYRNHIENHIKPALGATKLSALNAHTVQRFYNGLGKGRGDSAGLSASTVKITHGVLRQALQRAVASGYLHSNPADSCTLPRSERKEIKPLDDEQIRAFLSAIQGHRLETLFTVDLFTGMRQGEILGLQWDCVDFEHGVILIDKQLIQLDGVYSLAPLKNDKSRTITPAPWVMELLRTHRARQSEMRLRAGALWNNRWNLVFTNEVGEFIPHETAYKNFKRIARKIGIPAARFHDLRHSYAVASIRAGDDIKTVQGNLGHATAAFTLDVYAHVTEQMKQESARRMDGFIKGVLGL